MLNSQKSLVETQPVDGLAPGLLSTWAQRFQLFFSKASQQPRSSTLPETRSEGGAEDAWGLPSPSVFHGIGPIGASGTKAKAARRCQKSGGKSPNVNPNNHILLNTDNCTKAPLSKEGISNSGRRSSTSSQPVCSVHFSPGTEEEQGPMRLD